MKVEFREETPWKEHAATKPVALGDGRKPIKNPKDGFRFVKTRDPMSKKISDPLDRHTIRSQVTKVTRAKEADEGVKRKSKRRVENVVELSSPSFSEDSPYSSPDTLYIVAWSTSGGGQVRRRRRLSSPNPAPDAKAFIMDPSNTFPLTQGISRAATRRLWQYCSTEFIPLTFAKRAHEVSLRCRRLVETASTRHATYFGYCAMVEMYQFHAQRSHKPLSRLGLNSERADASARYGMFQQAAYRCMRKKDRRGDHADGDVFESLFALASAALIDGRFEEGRQLMLITCNREFAAKYQQPLSIPMYYTDVKVALALLARPLYSRPAPVRPIGESKLARALGRAPQFNRLAETFELIDIGSKLRDCLRDIKKICVTIELRSRGHLTPSENQLCSDQTQEIEHALLSYPYDLFSSGEESWRSLPLSATERLVQVAALCLISSVGMLVYPASPFGRRLTSWQVETVRDWMGSHARATADQSTMKMVLWTLFLAIDGAKDQPEELLFHKLLRYVRLTLGLDGWDEVEDILFGLLYIPKLKQETWKRIWETTARRFVSASTVA